MLSSPGFSCMGFDGDGWKHPAFPDSVCQTCHQPPPDFGTGFSLFPCPDSLRTFLRAWTGLCIKCPSIRIQLALPSRHRLQHAFSLRRIQNQSTHFNCPPSCSNHPSIQVIRQVPRILRPPSVRLSPRRRSHSKRYGFISRYHRPPTNARLDPYSRPPIVYTLLSRFRPAKA